MDIINISLAPNEVKQFRKGGYQLEILSASYPLGINTYDDNSGQTGSLNGAPAGLYVQGKFGAFDISNTGNLAQTVQLLIMDQGEQGGCRRVALNGALSLATVPASQTGSMSAVQKNVTTGSTQILAANSARQYLLLQNNDPAATFWVQVGGAAVANNCIKIQPGGFWEPATVPTGAIFILGSAASALCTAVEG